MNNNQLIAISILVSILIACCLIYIWCNSGNEKVIELSFTSLLIPVVIAFGLFLFELLKPVEVKKEKMLFAITTDPNILQQLSTNENGTYTEINQGTLNSTIFYDENKANLSFINDKNRIEIAELILLNLIHQRYSDHWQMEFHIDEAFFENYSTVYTTKNSLHNDLTSMTSEKLKENYSKNHLIQKINSDIGFALPSNTKYLTSGNNLHRSIEISNKYLTVIFTIEKIGLRSLPHQSGKTAHLIQKKLGLNLDESNRIDFYGFILKMNIKPNRFLKWNPNTIEQTEWLHELFTYLRMSYGWENIVKQLEEKEPR